jgi:hypothetical protein
MNPAFSQLHYIFIIKFNCLSKKRRYRDYPAVVVSGNRPDARMRVRSREQVEDIIPILQQANEYLLVEPLLKSVYELHIIRIGGIYRLGFKVQMK